MNNRANSHLFSLLILLLLFFKVLLPINTNAQSIVHRMYFFDPGIQFGIGFGPSIAFTDIKKYIIFPASLPKNEWRLSAQSNLEIEFTPLFSVRGQLSYGYIAGARPTSDRFFQAKLVEGNTSLIIRPVSFFVPYRSDYKWHPYIILGIGLSNYTSVLSRISSGEVIATRGFGGGRGLWGFTIEGVALGGLGVSYKVNEHWRLKFETANRWMDSDKLDIVESPNSSPYDFYNFTTIGISYKFFKKRNYPIINKKK